MKKLNKDAAPYFKNLIYFFVSVFSLLFSFFLFNPSKILAAPLSIGTAPTSEMLNLQVGEKYHGEIVIWSLNPPIAVPSVVLL